MSLRELILDEDCNRCEGDIPEEHNLPLKDKIHKSIEKEPNGAFSKRKIYIPETQKQPLEETQSEDLRSLLDDYY